MQKNRQLNAHHPVKWLFLFLFALLLSCTPESHTSEDAVPWSFVVLGDCRGGSRGSGVNEKILGKIAREVAAENIDFVMVSGDLIFGHPDRMGLGDDGALRRLEEEFRVYLRTMQPVYDKGIPVYNLRGNHETTQRDPDVSGTKAHRPVWPDAKIAWDNVFSGEYANPINGPEGEENVTFSFSHKNAFIVGMDVYSRPVDGVEMNEDGSVPFWAFHHVHQEWLDAQLAKNTRPHVFTFTHEPAFKADHTDCLHGNSAFGVDYSDKRDRFWNSIADAGARVYFCGHDHMYAHARIDNGDGNVYTDLHQFIIGNAGAGKDSRPVYDGYNGAFEPVEIAFDPNYGYALVHVRDNDVEIIYKRLIDENDAQFEVATRFFYSLDRAEVIPLPKAFAHNDYEQERPLFDALAHGFTVIEADVHEIDGELYVCHDAPESKEGIPTLSALYLDPLRRYIAENDGWVYKGFNEPLYLMIDFKTEAGATWEVLERQLVAYRDILSSTHDMVRIPKPVRVFISGNRPVETIMLQENPLAGLDGRISDLGKNISAQLMPIISSSSRDLTRWDGIGTMPEEDYNKIKNLAEQIHAEGKKFRIWAVPENEALWDVLLQAGVDFINADDLPRAKSYLLKD